MVDFQYHYIINKYGNDIKLLYSDTDSLTYHIKAKDMKNCMMIMINLIFQHIRNHIQILQETLLDTLMTVNPLDIMPKFQLNLKKILILKYQLT